MNTAARELLTDAERGVIETLLNAVYAAWNLADSTEDAGDITSVTVERGHFEDLSERLDALDALPDDQPEYTMAAAAKARWALRRLLDPTLTQQPAASEGDGRVPEAELLALVSGPYMYHHKMNELQEREAKGFDRCRELTMENIRIWCATRRAMFADNTSKQAAGEAVAYAEAEYEFEVWQDDFV